MRGVTWSDRAVENFAGQMAFIADRSPSAVALVRGRVLDAVAQLGVATTGRRGRKKGTFEKYVSKTSLILVYTLTDETSLTIVRVIHTSRDFTKNRWPS
jgi:toxin ParE1/3/4